MVYVLVALVLTMIDLIHVLVMLVLVLIDLVHVLVTLVLLILMLVLALLVRLWVSGQVLVRVIVLVSDGSLGRCWCGSSW